MNTESDTVNGALETLMNKVIKQYFTQNNTLGNSSSASNPNVALNDSNSSLPDLLNMMQTLLHKQARVQQPSTSTSQSDRKDAGISDKITSMTAFVNQAEQLGLLDNASSQKLKLLMTSYQVLEDGTSSERVTPPRTNETAFPVPFTQEQKLSHTLPDQTNPGTPGPAQNALQSAMLARLSQNKHIQDGVAVKHSPSPRTKQNASGHGFSPMVVFSETAVKSLISIYGQYRQDFIGHAKDRMRAWEKVCDEMRMRGFLFTRQQCKNKWHTLVYNYRQCNEYNRQVSSVGLGGAQGYKRKECPYYKDIADIMNCEDEDANFGQRVAPLFRQREVHKFGEVYTDTCSTSGPFVSGEPSEGSIESSSEITTPTMAIKSEPVSPNSSEQQTVFDYVVTSNEQSVGEGHDIAAKESDEQNHENLTVQADEIIYSPSPDHSSKKRKMSPDDQNDSKKGKPRQGVDSGSGVLCDSSNNNDVVDETALNCNMIRNNVSGSISGDIMDYIHFCERRNQQQLQEIKELFQMQEESRMRCHRENMEMMSQFLMVLRDISKK